MMFSPKAGEEENDDRFFQKLSNISNKFLADFYHDVTVKISINHFWTTFMNLFTCVSICLFVFTYVQVRDWLTCLLTLNSNAQTIQPIPIVLKDSS